MNTVPILFTFDQSLEIPAGVCITSLLLNASPDTFYDIFVLHGPQCDFSGSKINELARIYGNCRITFRKVEGEFSGAYQVRGIPETAYYRLISPELIPEYDKYLYSDVDVIFREDLWKYYSIDLGYNYFGGVDSCSVLRPRYQQYLAEAFGIDYRDGYYYSGNLIINAALIRKDNKLREFRELGKNNYDQQDMTIINLACKGRILPLSPAYCLTVNLYWLILNKRKEMEDLYGADIILHALEYGILHYNGAKPWDGPCLNMDVWWAYYRKSIFFDENFCYSFWEKERDHLMRLPFIKRVKILLRYPFDRKRRTVV